MKTTATQTKATEMPATMIGAIRYLAGEDWAAGYNDNTFRALTRRGLAEYVDGEHVLTKAGWSVAVQFAPSPAAILNAATDAYNAACLDVLCGKDRRDLHVLAFRMGKAQSACWKYQRAS